jgi:hypothetical protein
MRARPLLSLVTAAAAAACAFASPGAAQHAPAPRLADPFAGVRPRPDIGAIIDPRDTSDAPARAPVGRTPLERSAIAQSRLVEKGFNLWMAERTVGGRRLLFLRGWTGEGTGYQQAGILVFAADGRGGARRVWWGIAYEHVDVGGYGGTRRPLRWSIHGCLYIAGDRLVYVHSPFAAPERDGEPPPVSRSGTYAWDARTRAFARTGPAPAYAWERCRRAPRRH